MKSFLLLIAMCICASAEMRYAVVADKKAAEELQGKIDTAHGYPKPEVKTYHFAGIDELDDGTWAVALDEKDCSLVPEGIKIFDGVPKITKLEKQVALIGRFPSVTVESITASKASVKEVTVKP